LGVVVEGEALRARRLFQVGVVEVELVVIHALL
jgi:hypothetical protein